MLHPETFQRADAGGNGAKKPPGITSVPGKNILVAVFSPPSSGADVQSNPCDILLFSCSFGWGYCGDRERLAASLGDWRNVTCCGSIEAEQILDAFANGCDGVLILACRRGECHFQDGEWQCLKRLEILKPLLSAHGIIPERLQIRFGNDPSGDTMPGIVQQFRMEVDRL
jgi:coenzyme F420-reducing hydrogenase delta subunit